MKIVGALVIGVMIGCVGAMLGIGGGVLLVPALTELYRYDPRRAAALSLAAMVAPVTLPGAWQYYVQGHLRKEDIVLALCIGSALAVGTYIGAWLQPAVSVAWLRLGFGLLMIFVATRLILSTDRQATATFWGVLAVGIAWGGFLALRALGRRLAKRPQLAEYLRLPREDPQDPFGYYI